VADGRFTISGAVASWRFYFMMEMVQCRVSSMQIIDRYKTVVFLMALASIYLVSWLIQANTFVSGDVSLGLHEAARLFAGGSYGKDFFEVNPPLFLYLYMPPAIVATYLPIHVFTLFQLYIFLLASIALACCYGLIKPIFPATESIKRYGVMLMLTFVLVLLPLASAFGERDHLLMILVMPYFFLVGCRLENHRVKPSFALMIGLMAGLGFAIKPFFYLTFALVELYYAWCQRNWWAWLRIETLAIVGVSVIYLLTIWIFFQDYLTLIVPFARRLYYQGYSATWNRVLLNPAFLFCGLPVLLSLALYQINPYKKLSTVLLIAMLGLGFSYLMQRTPWYYHVYPPYALAILSSVYFFSLFVAQKQVQKTLYLQMILVGLLAFALLDRHQTLVITLVLYALLACCLLSLGIILLQTGRNKFHLLFCTVIGALALSLPLSYAAINLIYSLSFKEKSSALIALIKLQAPHKPIYFLSSTLQIEFPLMDYAGAIPASQYPSLWWFSGYIHQTHAAISKPLRAQLEQDRDYFLNSIANELASNQPELVFVESGSMAPNIDGRPFNYVNDFRQNAQFRAAWKNYRYLTALGMEPFYQYQVYQRVRGTL
jgi:hypothetical protein